MISYSQKSLKSDAPQMIIDLCEKYGWNEYINQSYPNEIIFKHGDYGEFIYIYLEDNTYYLSTPLVSLRYNYKESCGMKGDPAIFYTIYDRLEKKLQYIQDSI